jgi:hypothetical protein
MLGWRKNGSTKDKCTAASNPYYTGEGGKGMSIFIQIPSSVGLADHIPLFVMQELDRNFTASAFSVKNPVRRQSITDELNSGFYDDEAGMGLGHDTPTDYTMDGTITKTATGYALRISVNRTTDQTGVATFLETCTFEELENLIATRRASLYLLEQMGVALTKQAKAELTKAAVSKEVAAKTALAKSVTAGTAFERMYYTYQAPELDPTLQEAAMRLAAYQTEIYKAPKITFVMPELRTPEIKAPEFKAPEIKMAATGNIGADARKQLEQYNAQKEVSRLRQESGNRAVQDLQDAFLNQFKALSETVKKQQADLLGQRDRLLVQQKTLLERQRQMIAQLRETENSYDTFFTEYPPFEIIYDPAVKQVGSNDLGKGTIDMQFRITTVGTQAMQVVQSMLTDFEKGLGTIAQGLKDINVEFDRVQPPLEQVEAAGKSALTQLMKDYAAQVAQVAAAEHNYAAQLARLDAELKTTGYAQLGRDYAVRTDIDYGKRLAEQYAVQSANYDATNDKTIGDTWRLTKWNKDESRTFAIEARLENDAGKTIGTAVVNLTNRTLAAAYTQPMSDSVFCVFQGVPAYDITDKLQVLIQRVNSRDVTAAANADYIKISPLEADGYTKDGWNIDGYGKNGRNQMGLTRKGAARPSKDIENKAKKAVRQAHVQEMWGGVYLGSFIGGAGNVQPSGGLFEFGFEVGGKWLTVDFGLGWGGGGLKIDDEIVEKKLGPIDWSRDRIFSPRLGAAFPLNFEKARLNIGGGFEFLNLRVDEYIGKKDEGAEGNRIINGNVYAGRGLDLLLTPYVGARLDIAFTKRGGLLGFIGYRCGFPPADQFETYFEKPASLRHTIFAGLEARVVFRRYFTF